MGGAQRAAHMGARAQKRRRPSGAYYIELNETSTGINSRRGVLYLGIGASLLARLFLQEGRTRLRDGSITGSQYSIDVLENH